jgi:hypothetical protein
MYDTLKKRFEGQGNSGNGTEETPSAPAVA